MSQLPHMLNPYEFMYQGPREFLLLSACLDPTKLTYDAEEFTVPAFDQIVMPDPKAPFRPHSAKNSVGEWIPGSLLVRDIPGVRGCPDDQTGNLRGSYWDAWQAIVHCLKIDPNSKQATSAFAEKGIALLPLNPSPDMVAQIRAELKERSKKFNLAAAKKVVEGYKEQASKYKTFGYEPPIPGDDYENALLVVQQAKREREERFRKLGLPDPLTEGTTSGQLVVEEDEEFMAVARLAADKAAGKIASEDPKVNRDELVEILMKDPEFKKAIKAKYSVRKLSSREMKDAQSFGGA